MIRFYIKINKDNIYNLFVVFSSLRKLYLKDEYRLIVITDSHTLDRYEGLIMNNSDGHKLVNDISKVNQNNIIDYGFDDVCSVFILDEYFPKKVINYKKENLHLVDSKGEIKAKILNGNDFPYVEKNINSLFQKIDDEWIENNNLRIKSLIFEDLSLQIKGTLDKMRNSASFRSISEISISREVLKKLDSVYFSKKNKNKISSEKYNHQIINSHDLIITQNNIFEWAPNWRKTDSNVQLIEFFHGTIVKNPFAISKWNGKADYIISPNEWTTHVLRAIGFNDQEILKIGYPRINEYKKILSNFQKDSKVNLDLIESLPEKFRNKEMVTFAPSWIKTKNADGEIDVVEVSIDEILKKINPKKEFLYISHHTNTHRLNNIKYTWSSCYDGLVLFAQPTNINETYKLFVNSTKMITDFSSVIFDYGDIKGFENIEFFNPLLDPDLDENARKYYEIEYGNYGNWIKPITLSSIKSEHYAKWFSSYDNGEWNSVDSIFDFISDLVLKKFMIKVSRYFEN